jgi:hypothetical protein
MLPQHRNESNEQYTPLWLLDIAHEILGPGIDLDPASSRRANKSVGAKTIFTEKQNGLVQDWSFARTIWLNPPGGIVDVDGRTVIRASKEHQRESCSVTGACGLEPGHKHKGITSSAARWWNKLANWYAYQHRVLVPSSALYLMFSLEMLQSCQRFTCAHPLDFSICVFRDRLQFDTVEDGKLVVGEQPTHASTLVLLTHSEAMKTRFANLLAPKGKVVLK